MAIWKLLSTHPAAFLAAEPFVVDVSIDTWILCCNASSTTMNRFVQMTMTRDRKYHAQTVISHANLLEDNEAGGRTDLNEYDDSQDGGIP